jgi:glycosyltransferase involved in cell wall biosynthesis
MVLCVSRLAKEKSIDVLIDALALAGSGAGLQLAIAGDGPAREELEALARERGVDGRTHFLGIVAREQLPDLYASADVFAMPSTTETQGLVLAEALAAGCAVIAADAPQNRDVLGGAATIVAPDPGAFAGAMLAVPARREEKTSRIARLAAQRFSVDGQVDRILSLYESLVRPARIA